MAARVLFSTRRSQRLLLPAVAQPQVAGLARPNQPNAASAKSCSRLGKGYGGLDLAILTLVLCTVHGPSSDQAFWLRDAAFSQFHAYFAAHNFPINGAPNAATLPRSGHKTAYPHAGGTISHLIAASGYRVFCIV